MIVCSIQQAGKMYGGNRVFEELSFEIHEGDRAALVGRNGSGKTTVMKLLAGKEAPDEGVISLKKGLKVGYLAQIPTFEKNFRVEDVLRSAFSETMEIGVRMQALETRMALEGDRIESILEEYGTLQERFSLLGGYEVEAKISRIANGLQLNPLMGAAFEMLSGGEQTKVCLGLLLLTSPDLLLLDEPTNHLDIAAVEWLEQFLKEYEGTVVLISHDRFFLDEAATKIIDIEDGVATIYHSNYSGFVTEKEARLLEEFQAYQEQQKKIKKMKEAIKRLREWANRANPPNEGLHKRARNMERALERMEKLKRPILERKKMGLQLESGERSGKDVILIKNASKSFGQKVLFQEINFHLRFQERIAIVGKNGSGKSTLLKIIQQEVEVDQGQIQIGSSVKIGYLSQHLYIQNSSQTVIEAFREEISITEGEARHILARFLFYGPAVFRKVGQLSGGERMRLKLAQLMHQDINLLILDEPTNHLDIDSREVLEEALEEFNGTILAVSHDRYLLNNLFPKTCWLDDGYLYTFTGNYNWAKVKLDEQKKKLIQKQEQKPKEIKVVKSEKRTKQNELSNKPEYSAEKVEERINLLDKKLSEINAKMQGETDLQLLNELYEEQTKLEQEQTLLYEKLEEFLENTD
ncbi:ATPase subunit of ABC transporter with duplicated ATPase domains [Peribacillus deserti]|uniref:ATPase subunit of ABC transporter with duplicated ATPase domains n=1 Tax=Peribacillus deserti TaxID=673318 RepID=A0ABS2QN25_9BACI|nr:ABC-F type ribosomal protection protein [Peribacillus deserti]MBM7693671.1 ATPase subunit of ABC transporter with duplicated ATPase domains [Peribacillus deserti]